MEKAAIKGMMLGVPVAVLCGSVKAASAQYVSMVTSGSFTPITTDVTTIGTGIIGISLLMLGVILVLKFLH